MALLDLQSLDTPETPENDGATVSSASLLLCSSSNASTTLCL